VICVKDQGTGASACDTKRVAVTRGPKASMSASGWEHFAHDADIGLCGWGATAAEAFEQAGQALIAAVTDAAILPHTSVDVHCEAGHRSPLRRMAERHYLRDGGPEAFVWRLYGSDRWMEDDCKARYGASRSMSSGTLSLANQKEQPIRR
jgi:hypothetical protein